MAEWGDEWGELWGGAIALIQTHEDDAVDRLKFHLNGKANAESVVQIFAERWQIIDNFLSDLLTLIDLDNSFGDLQDKLGKILNVDRAGFLDEDYARFLNAKALVLIRKRKTLPGLLELARALMGPKSLASLEPFIWDPDMSTLIDRVTASIGTADGTTYDAATDARDFDGLTDRIDFANIADLTGSPFSISLRVSTTGVTGTDNLLSLQKADQGNAIRLFAQSGSVTMRIGGTVDRTRSGVITLSGTSQHIVCTVDGTDLATGIRFFLDGIETSYAAPADGSVPDASDGLWCIGGRSISDTVNFAGRIRDVQAWDRVLTGAEVLTLFQGGKRFIGFKETFPKAFQLTLEGITTEEEIVFREFLRTARPATYNGTVLVVPDPAFGYDDSTGAFPTDVEGFDNASAPLTFGGPYAHLFVL